MTTTNKQKNKKAPSPPANTAMVFAIEFPDKTIAICKGKEVVKVICRNEKPDGWEINAWKGNNNTGGCNV